MKDLKFSDTQEAFILKQFEGENAMLRELVADLALDPAMLQDVIRRKPGGLVASASPSTLICGERHVSIRRACAVLEFDTSSYHHNRAGPTRPLGSPDKGDLRDPCRYGYRRVQVLLERGDISIRRVLEGFTMS